MILEFLSFKKKSLSALNLKRDRREKDLGLTPGG